MVGARGHQGDGGSYRVSRGWCELGGVKGMVGAGGIKGIGGNWGHQEDGGS